MFEKVVQISNHGTASGIWPRFFLQMDEIAKLGVGKDEFDKRLGIYMDNVMPQIEKFYDLYQKFLGLNQDYREGIQSGKYYSVDKKGTINHNKIPEREIFNIVKDFFVNGKIMLVNFVKCGIIDDDPFKFETFYFCDEKKFKTRKEDYLNNSNGIFLSLINLLEKSQHNFLQSFNEIRGDIEHNQFIISDYKIENSNQDIIVIEPIFEGRILSETLKFYYENIFDLIEKLIAYFFGIKAEIKSRILQLYVRHEWNYPEMLYKYTIAFGGNVLMGTPADKCLYD